MEVIHGLLPAMLLLGLVGVVVFFWAVRNGQYDDMEGAANRVLMDEDTIISPDDDESEAAMIAPNEPEDSQSKSKQQRQPD